MGRDAKSLLWSIHGIIAFFSSPVILGSVYRNGQSLWFWLDMRNRPHAYPSWLDISRGVIMYAALYSVMFVIC